MTGFAKKAVRTATPMKTSPAPAPTRAMSGMVGSGRSNTRPTVMIAIPTADTPAPIRARRRKSSLDSGTCALLRAATGGILEADRAGRTAETTVMTTPVAIPISTVRPAICSGAEGKAPPKDNRPRINLASTTPSPSNGPTHTGTARDR